jgi:hypothetical protein
VNGGSPRIRTVFSPGLHYSKLQREKQTRRDGGVEPPQPGL